MKGVGIDLIEIERIRQSCQNYGKHFLDRIFTEKEQEYCSRFSDPLPNYAGRFAAKEAVSKALGTGFGEKLSWHDIEILNDSEGKPILHLSLRAKKTFEDPHILLSISHSKSAAAAVAIWER